MYEKSSKTLTRFCMLWLPPPSPPPSTHSLTQFHSATKACCQQLPRPKPHSSTVSPPRLKTLATPVPQSYSSPFRPMLKCNFLRTLVLSFIRLVASQHHKSISLLFESYLSPPSGLFGSPLDSMPSNSTLQQFVLSKCQLKDGMSLTWSSTDVEILRHGHPILGALQTWTEWWHILDGQDLTLFSDWKKGAGRNLT